MITLFNQITKSKKHQIYLLNLGQKNCFEVIDDTRGAHDTNSQFKFKTMMLNSSLCNYNDACVHVKGTISITQVPNNNSKEVVFKN